MDSMALSGAIASAPILSAAVQKALQSGDGLLERLPIGIYTCDRDGVLLHYNRRAAELWGRAPTPGNTQHRFCGALRAYRLNGEPLPLRQSPMSEVLRTGKPIRDRELVVERPDGTRITILANLDPLFGTDGEIIGGVNCFQDISELKRAQQHVRQSERWLGALLDALPAAVYTTDEAGRLTYCNQAAVDLWGRRPVLGETVWCGSWRLYWPDGTPMPLDECPMAIALKENRPVRDAEAVVERPDGTRIPFLPYPTPLHDSSGALVGAVNMLVDISHRKQSEERLGLLAREVNHRANNVLGLVQGAVRLSDAPTVGEFKEAVEGRIRALARAHSLLAGSSWDGADLHRLVDDELSAYLHGESQSTCLQGPRVVLEPKAAQSMAVALHELATNAAKYGALSVPTGHVTITWANDERGGVVFRWEESGGPPVVQPSHRGFGSKIIRRMIRDQLQGTISVDWRAEGLVCVITVPSDSIKPETDLAASASVQVLEARTDGSGNELRTSHWYSTPMPASAIG